MKKLSYIGLSTGSLPTITDKKKIWSTNVNNEKTGNGILGVKTPTLVYQPIRFSTSFPDHCKHWGCRDVVTAVSFAPQQQLAKPISSCQCALLDDQRHGTRAQPPIRKLQNGLNKTPIKKIAWTSWRIGSSQHNAQLRADTRRRKGIR